jgi:hypothetical protein
MSRDQPLLPILLTSSPNSLGTRHTTLPQRTPGPFTKYLVVYTCKTLQYHIDLLIYFKFSTRKSVLDLLIKISNARLRGIVQLVGSLT